MSASQEARIAALEAALAEREGRFAALIDGLQVGVVVHSPAAEILLCNAKALELLGVSAAEMAGRTAGDAIWDIVREDGTPFPGDQRPAMQALRQRVPIRDVLFGVRRPGEDERVWLLVTAMPQLRDDGSVVQVVATFANVTRRRRVEEALREQTRRIRELSTPLIPIDDTVLVAPIIGELDRERADQLLEVLLAGIVEARARVVILDVTGVPELDEAAGEALQRCVGAVRLLGARLLVTGVRPRVAAALVDRHVELAGIEALPTLQQGIAAARRMR